MDRAALITSNPQTNFTSTLIPQSDKPIAQTDFINEIWDYLTGKSSSDLFKLFSVAILISLWIFYITLINSHLFGWLLTQFLNHFLLRFVWGTDAYFKVSAISVSILTGRIVIRDLRFVTPDFRVRVCDGVFVFKWWRTYRRRKGTWCTDMRLLWYRHIVRKPLPDNLVSAVNARTSLSEPSSARPNSRASIHLYGFDIHFINRTQVYSRLIHFFNLEDSRWNLKEQDTLSPATETAPSSNRLIPTGWLGTVWSRVYAWLTDLTPWKLRQFFPLVKCSIRKARIMFGNDLLPSKFCITAELLRAKYTTPDSETHDEFSHLIQCNVRHAAVTLLPNERFCAPLPPDAKDERRVRLEKPPLRPAGAPSSASAGAAGKRPPLPAQTDDSCVTLASVANFDLLYKQDVPGVVPREPERMQLIGGDVVVKPSFPDWRVEVTTLSEAYLCYGPWFDRQRDALWKMFFQGDYQQQKPTVLPKVGESRIARSFQTVLNASRPVTLELLFYDHLFSDDKKNPKCESLSVTVGGGSTVNLEIPWIVGEKGTETSVNAHVVEVDIRTSLPFRPLAYAHTLDVKLAVQFPLDWNGQQQYLLEVELERGTAAVFYQLIFFFQALGFDWASRHRSDLLTFVPYTYFIKMKAKDFEALIPVNEYNWIDSTANSVLNMCNESEENAYIGVLGKQLEMQFIVPFFDFLAPFVDFDMLFKGTTLSGWLYLPTLNSSGHLLRAQSPQTGWLRLFDRNGNVTLSSPRAELVAATSSAPDATDLPAHRRPTGANASSSAKAVKATAAATTPSTRRYQTQCNCTGSLPDGRWSRLIHYQKGWVECIFGPTLTAHIVYRFHITPLVHDPSVFLVPSARVPTSPRSPTSVASDAHAAAPRPEELIKAFDRSTLEPDFVWIQLDAGPDVTAYLHASLIRYIIHFKENFFGYHLRLRKMVDPSEGALAPIGHGISRLFASFMPRSVKSSIDQKLWKSLAKPNAPFDPRKYRPFNVWLHVSFKDLFIHLPKPSGDRNAPCACVMLECVAVEVDKQYNDTRIQILTSPVAVGCRDSSAVDEGAAVSRSDSERSASAEQRQLGAGGATGGGVGAGAGAGAGHHQASPLSSAPGDSAGSSSEQHPFRHLRSAAEAHLADGFAVLMGLQLRMHAMFSREGLQHEAETLEYAWLIEVELGHVLARLNPAHLVNLIYYVETVVFLIEEAENELTPPENMCELCIHGNMQLQCSSKKKTLKKCIASDDIKYKFVRVRLRSVNVFLVESGVALNLEIERPIRIAFCNLHNEINKAGVTAVVERVQARQLVFGNEVPITSARLPSVQLSQWLVAAEAAFGPLSLDAGIALPDPQMHALQTRFLKRHDRRTRRLWFLWEPYDCGCLGFCSYFGDRSNLVDFYPSSLSGVRKPSTRPDDNQLIEKHGDFVVPNGVSFAFAPTALFDYLDDQANRLASLQIIDDDKFHAGASGEYQILQEEHATLSLSSQSSSPRLKPSAPNDDLNLQSNLNRKSMTLTLDSGASARDDLMSVTLRAPQSPDERTIVDAASARVADASSSDDTDRRTLVETPQRTEYVQIHAEPTNVSKNSTPSPSFEDAPTSLPQSPAYRSRESTVGPSTLTRSSADHRGVVDTWRFSITSDTTADDRLTYATATVSLAGASEFPSQATLTDPHFSSARSPFSASQDTLEGVAQFTSAQSTLQRSSIAPARAAADRPSRLSFLGDQQQQRAPHSQATTPGEFQSMSSLVTTTLQTAQSCGAGPHSIQQTVSATSTAPYVSARSTVASSPAKSLVTAQSSPGSARRRENGNSEEFRSAEASATNLHRFGSVASAGASTLSGVDDYFSVGDEAEIAAQNAKIAALPQEFATGSLRASVERLPQSATAAALEARSDPELGPSAGTSAFQRSSIAGLTADELARILAPTLCDDNDNVSQVSSVSGLSSVSRRSASTAALPTSAQAAEGDSAAAPPTTAKQAAGSSSGSGKQESSSTVINLQKDMTLPISRSVFLIKSYERHLSSYRSSAWFYRSDAGGRLESALSSARQRQAHARSWVALELEKEKEEKEQETDELGIQFADMSQETVFSLYRSTNLFKPVAIAHRNYARSVKLLVSLLPQFHPINAGLSSNLLLAKNEFLLQQVESGSVRPVNAGSSHHLLPPMPEETSDGVSSKDSRAVSASESELAAAGVAADGQSKVSRTSGALKLHGELGVVVTPLVLEALERYVDAIVATFANLHASTILNSLHARCSRAVKVKNRLKAEKYRLNQAAKEEQTQEAGGFGVEKAAEAREELCSSVEMTDANQSSSLTGIMSSTERIQLFIEVPRVNICFLQSAVTEEMVQLSNIEDTRVLHEFTCVSLLAISLDSLNVKLLLSNQSKTLALPAPPSASNKDKASTAAESASLAHTDAAASEVLPSKENVAYAPSNAGAGAGAPVGVSFVAFDDRRTADSESEEEALIAPNATSTFQAGAPSVSPNAARGRPSVAAASTSQLLASRPKTREVFTENIVGALEIRRIHCQLRRLSRETNFGREIALTYIPDHLSRAFFTVRPPPMPLAQPSQPPTLARTARTKAAAVALPTPEQMQAIAESNEQAVRRALDQFGAGFIMVEFGLERINARCFKRSGGATESQSDTANRKSSSVKGSSQQLPKFAITGDEPADFQDSPDEDNESHAPNPLADSGASSSSTGKGTPSTVEGGVSYGELRIGTVWANFGVPPKNKQKKAAQQTAEQEAEEEGQGQQRSEDGSYKAPAATSPPLPPPLSTFSRFDWNLLSSASTCIAAWMSPASRLSIVAASMHRALQTRWLAVVASLSVLAMDRTDLVELHKSQFANLTILSRIVRNDPSCRLCTVLRRFLALYGVPRIEESLRDAEHLPSLERLEKGIRATTREWRNRLFVAPFGPAASQAPKDQSARTPTTRRDLKFDLEPEFLAQLYELSDLDHPETVEVAKRRLQEAQTRYPLAAQGSHDENPESPSEYPVASWMREGRPKWTKHEHDTHRFLERQPSQAHQLLEGRRGSAATGLANADTAGGGAAGFDYSDLMEEQRKALKLYRFLERQKHNVMNFLDLSKRSPTDADENLDETGDDSGHKSRRNTMTARTGEHESPVRVDIEGAAGGLQADQSARQPPAAGEGSKQPETAGEAQEPQDEAYSKNQMELAVAANMLIQATNAQALFKPLIEALGLHVARIKTAPLMKKFGSCISLSLLLDALSLNIAESEGNPLNNPADYLRLSKRSIDLASRSPSFTCEHFILNLSLREVLNHNPKGKSKQGTSGDAATDANVEPASDSRPENQPSSDDLETRRTTTHVSLTISVESIVQHVDMPLIRLVYQIYTIALNVTDRQQQILLRKHEISSEFRKTHRKQESKSSSASTATTVASTTSSTMPVTRFESGITSFRSHPRTPAGSGGGVPLPPIYSISNVDAPFTIAEQSAAQIAPVYSQPSTSVTFTPSQIPGIRIEPPAASSTDGQPAVRMRPTSRVKREGNSFRKSILAPFAKLRLVNRKTAVTSAPNPESHELTVFVSSAGNAHSSESQPSATQPLGTHKCWLKMEEAIRIYTIFPGLKTITLQPQNSQTASDGRVSVAPLLTPVPEDEEHSTGGLLAAAGAGARPATVADEQAAAAHAGERRVKITEPTIDQLTHGSALSALIGDRVSVALFSSFNIHRTKVIAKISGLRLEVEFMQIQASATHSRRVHSRMIGESKSMNNSLSAHVGTILTTLSESGSTTQQGVVASINVNTIAAFVAQQERRRSTPPGKPARRQAQGAHRRNENTRCSCSLALERITIDIPNQPVALHDMFTRSTKRITNTIQELTRSMYQPVVKSKLETLSEHRLMEQVIEVRETPTTEESGTTLTDGRRLPPLKIPLTVRFIARMKLFEIYASILPSLRAHYQLGPLITKGLAGATTDFSLVVPSHSFHFRSPAPTSSPVGGPTNITPLTRPSQVSAASDTLRELSAEPGIDLPAFHIFALLSSALSPTPQQQQAPTASRPQLPTASLQPSAKPTSPPVDGPVLEVGVVFEHFCYSLPTDLINHIIIAQKVLVKEIQEILNKVTGNENDEHMAELNNLHASSEHNVSRQISGPIQSAPDQRKPLQKFYYLITLMFKGINLSATTQSFSALRFKNSAINVVIGNIVRSADFIPSRVCALPKLQISADLDIDVSLGQILKTTASPERAPAVMSRLAFFKTEIAVRNAQPDEVAPMIENSGVAGFTRASVHQAAPVLQRKRPQSDRQQQRERVDSLGASGAPPSPLFLLQTNQIEHDALLITLQQPVVYVRPSALDHALVVWLNYKHAYDFWVEEMSAQKSELMAQMVQSQRVQPVSARPASIRTRSTASPSSGLIGRLPASPVLSFLVPPPPLITTTSEATPGPGSGPGSTGASPGAATTSSSSTLTLKQVPSASSANSGSGHSTLPTPQPTPQPQPAYPSILFLELTVVNMGICLALDTPSHFSENADTVAVAMSSSESPASVARYSPGAASRAGSQSTDQGVMFEAHARSKESSPSIVPTPRAVYAAHTSPALVATWRETKISACSWDAIVSKGKFTDFCIRFTDEFNPSVPSWGPDKLEKIERVNRNERMIPPLVMNACVVPQGTCDICSSSNADLHHNAAQTPFRSKDAKAKWSMIFSWEMRGLDMHFDTTLGNRTSRLIKSLTSLAEPQAPEKPEAAQSSLSSTPAVGSSSAIGGTMLESDGERLGLAFRRSLEDASVASTGAAQRPQHIRQRSLDSPEPLHMRGVLSTVAESDRTSENSQLFASDAALDSPDHLARWDDTTLPYTLRLRALKSELLFLHRSLNEEQDPEAKANFQRRIQQMLTKQRELCLNEAKINRVKILSSFGSGPTKSHYDSSVPGHTRLKSGFLDSLAEVGGTSTGVTGRSLMDSPLKEEDETRVRDRESDSSSRELSPAASPITKEPPSETSTVGAVLLRKVPGRSRRTPPPSDQADGSKFFSTAPGDVVDAGAGAPGAGGKSKFELELDVSILVERGRCVLHPKLAAAAGAAAAGQAPKSEANKVFDYERRWREFNAQRSPITDLTVFVLPGFQLKLHLGPHDKLGLPLDLKKPVSSTALQAQPPGQKQRSMPSVGETSSLLILRPEQRLASSKRPCLYVFFGVEKLTDEMLITPAVMDFVEQTLEPLEMELLFAPSKRVVSETGSKRSSLSGDVVSIGRGADADTLSGAASQKKADEQPPAAFLASTVLPFDLVLYVRIERSALRFNCVPVSRVECLLRTPCFELLASTRSSALALGDLTLGEEQLQVQVKSESFEDARASLLVPSHQPLQTRPSIVYSTKMTASERLARAAFASSSLSGTGELAPVENMVNVTALLSDFSFTVSHPFSQLKDRYGDVGFAVLDSSSFGSVGTDSKQDPMAFTLEYIHLHFSRGARMLYFNAPPAQSKTLSNSLHISVMCDIGHSAFKHDFRRFSELLAVPMAWYRPQIMRRLFIGDASPEILPASSAASGGPSEGPKAPPSGSTALRTQTASTLTADEMIYMPAEDAKTMRLYWDSRVVVSFAMREVDVQISMTQVLGGLRLRLRDLHALGSFLVDFKGSQKHRVSASLHRSQLEATGGQTSGYLELSRLSIYGHLFDEAEKDPSHRISCQLLRLETRIEFMANPIVLARLSSLDLLLYDSWSFNEFLEAWKKMPPAKSRAAGHARTISTTLRPSLSDLPPARIEIDGHVKWDMMHLMMTSSTTLNAMRIVSKVGEYLHGELNRAKADLNKITAQTPGLAAPAATTPAAAASFFQPAADRAGTSLAPQWNTDRNAASKTATTKEQPVELRSHERHWPPVLDAFAVARFLFVERRLQSSGASLSMSSVPIVFGGLLLLKGNNFILACFNGSNFRVHNWLVFSLDEPNVEFISEANRNSVELDTSIRQVLTFNLGHEEFVMRGTPKKLALILRVKAPIAMPITNGTVSQMFNFALASPALGGLSKRFPPSPDYEEPVSTSASGFRTDPSLETEVIFALPQLQLKLVTEHVQAVSEPSASDAKRPPVVCSFLAEVLHPVCITVDVEAIEFVREVILGYINEFKKGRAGLYNAPPTRAIEEIAAPTIDFREFNTANWHLNAAIQLMGPVSGVKTTFDPFWVLDKLGFKQPTQTIPKGMQRALLDQLDALIAGLTVAMVRRTDARQRLAAKQTSQK